ncbi:Dam family site-specific DNA-(adenine-N6)-methyltransferase [Alteromonas antoniana]|uniref:Dam family site-specific DNA-(adenine-N6)-methyltransferase n=1 Tax=Alteromonas antoniana TaxID=2803813 RepID=UPI001C45852B|nr:Dam family site-specific DNA-(adenine-N6)-methyltransferase [Alteromonas antoniana]
MATRKKQRSFLKWAGGKYQLLDRLTLILPEGKRLIEPFVGSGVVFLNTDYQSYLLNDNNVDLMSVYQYLKSDGPMFITEVERLFKPMNNTEGRYYALRESFNSSCDPLERAALFVYFNRHGYNGLCRYNRQGKFNVPFGRYKSPRFPGDEMATFAQKLRKAQLTSTDFTKAFARARKGNVILCDPPYLSLSNTSNFISYSPSSFDMRQQALLAVTARRAAKRGVRVVICNHDTADARELYKGAEIESFPAARKISCRGDTRQPVVELTAQFAPSSW